MKLNTFNTSEGFALFDNYKTNVVRDDKIVLKFFHNSWDSLTFIHATLSIIADLMCLKL